jgi:magnesium-transporting ATPase (P-type)
MQRKPRDKKEHILSHSIKFILIISIIEFFVLFGLFWQWQSVDLEKARTLVITTSIVFQFFVSFSVRSEKFNFWELKVNRYLVGSILIAMLLHLILIYSPLHIRFKFVSLSGSDRLTIVGLGSV